MIRRIGLALGILMLASGLVLVGNGMPSLIPPRPRPPVVHVWVPMARYNQPIHV